MHLLCFLAGVQRVDPELVLARARRVLEETMPRFPIPLEAAITLLPELQGGWLSIVPARSGLRSRLSSHVGDDLAVLLYGELFGIEDADAVHTVTERWRSGGPNAVRDLDGCFSAVVVERKARRCTVVSDLIGRRTLRYARSDGALILATHDLALVATGLVPPRVDMLAVKSVAAYGWSLGGKPLLEGVEPCEPESIVRYSDGDLTVTREPRLRTAPVSGTSRRRREREVLDAMIEQMRNICRAAAKGSELVKTDLTAGLDSRCVLAVLRSTVDAGRLVAGTEGEETDLDVVIARRVAQKVGIKHSLDVRATPEPARMMERLDVLAFSSSGDTDGKRALTDIFRNAEFADPHTRFYGSAGENFRGGFYPSSSFRSLTGLTFQGVVDHIVRVYSRLDSLEWRDATTRAELVRLLERVLRGHEGNARLPIDLFDYYYALERSGRWGAFAARATWWAQYVSPFTSSSMLHLWFQLPPPLGAGSRLHRAILHRFMPECYYLPLVNDSLFVPLLRSQRVADRAGALWSRWGSRAARAKSAERAMKSGTRTNLDKWSADHMQSSIRPEIERLLTSTGSVTQRVFTPESVGKMLEDLRKDEWGMVTVGTLLTMERWAGQIDRAWELARLDDRQAN